MASQPPNPPLSKKLLDLPEALIGKILGRLSGNLLLATERVCRVWRRCVHKTLGDQIEIISFRYGMLDYKCSHYNQAYNEWQVIVLTDEHYENKFNSDYQKTVIPFLSRCPKIICLDLSSVTVNIACLKDMVKVCPKLECLMLSNVVATDKEWNEWAKEVAPKLVHLNVTDGFNLPLHQFMEAANKIRHVHLGTNVACPRFLEMISQLDDVKNIKKIVYSLKLEGELPNRNPSKIIDAIKWVNYLSVDLTTLQDFYKQCWNSMDKVTLLSVDQKGAIFKEEKYELNMKFPQVEILELTNFDFNALKWTADHKFPLLNRLRLYALNLKSGETLECLFSKMPNLTKLSIDRYVGIELILLSRLKDLNVNLGVSDAATIPQITQMLKYAARIRLDKFYLSCCFGKMSVPITDKRAFVNALCGLIRVSVDASIEVQLVFSCSNYAVDDNEVTEWHGQVVNRIRGVELVKDKAYIMKYEGDKVITTYVNTFKMRVKFGKI